jgi:hypothetical protein
VAQQDQPEETQVDDYAPYQEQDFDRQPDEQGERPSPVQEEIREGDASDRQEHDVAYAGRQEMQSGAREPQDREELAGSELEHSGAYGGAQGHEGEEALGLDGEDDAEDATIRDGGGEDTFERLVREADWRDADAPVIDDDA